MNILIQLLQLIILQVIIVFIVDLSGVVIEFKKFLLKTLLKKYPIPLDSFTLKPFDCSLCMTFWIGLIWILLNGQFQLLNILIICLLAYLTPVTSSMLILLKDKLLLLLNKFN